MAEVHGVFTQEDFDDVFLPRLREILKEFPSASIVIEFNNDFRGWELITLWREVQLSIEYFNVIDKMAIIGQSKILKWIFHLLHPLSLVSIERFTHGEIEKAKAWAAIT